MALRIHKDYKKNHEAIRDLNYIHKLMDLHNIKSIDMKKDYDGLTITLQNN